MSNPYLISHNFVITNFRRKNPGFSSLKNRKGMRVENLELIVRSTFIPMGRKNGQWFFSEAERNGVFRFAQNRMHFDCIDFYHDST